MFNDFVDLAFCVDVRRVGYHVVQDFTLRLPHSMGSRREHGVGSAKVRIIHCPPGRHYWIAQGRVVGRQSLGYLPEGAYPPGVRDAE